MLAFILQSLLLLLLAFFLGWLLGRFLKSIFCHRSLDNRADDDTHHDFQSSRSSQYNLTTPHVDRDDDSSISTLAKGAATVAGAAAATKLASDAITRNDSETTLADTDIDIVRPEIDSDIDIPDLDTSVELPDATIADVELPDVDTSVELPDANIEGVELPEMKVGEVDVPEVDTDIDLQDLDTSVELPDANIADVELPDVDASVELPDANIEGLELPEMKVGEVDVPEVDTDIDLPDFDTSIELPDTNITDVELPNVDTSVELPDANIEGVKLPEMEVGEIDVPVVDTDIDLPDLDTSVELPDATIADVELPDMNASVEAPDAELPNSDGLSDTLKGAALAAAGAIAATSITNKDDEDTALELSETDIEGTELSNVDTSIELPNEDVELSAASPDAVEVPDTELSEIDEVDQLDVDPTVELPDANTESIELTDTDPPIDMESAEQAEFFLDSAPSQDHDKHTQELDTNDHSLSGSLATAAAVGSASLAAIQGIRSVDAIDDEMSQLKLIAGESLELNPQQYDKLGILHCGVTLNGFISVVGDVATIEDKQTLFFERNNISVRRDDDTFTFIKWLKETS